MKKKVQKVRDKKAKKAEQNAALAALERVLKSFSRACDRAVASGLPTSRIFSMMMKTVKANNKAKEAK